MYGVCLVCLVHMCMVCVWCVGVYSMCLYTCGGVAVNECRKESVTCAV